MLLVQRGLRFEGFYVQSLCRNLSQNRMLAGIRRQFVFNQTSAALFVPSDDDVPHRISAELRFDLGHTLKEHMLCGFSVECLSEELKLWIIFDSNAGQ